jgi:DNA-binding PadR family transcriptional regulator
MLTFAPMSGYDMKKFSEQSLAHFWHESYGNLYPRLRKLEAAGFVRKRRERRERAPDAMVYRITAAGRRSFRAWMDEDPEPEQVQSEFMLRIFFGVEVGLDRCGVLIRDYRAEQEAKRDAYAGIEQMISHGLSDHADALYWLMSLRRGQLLTEARLAWCNECEDLLSRSSDSDATARPVVGSEWS